MDLKITISKYKNWIFGIGGFGIGFLTGKSACKTKYEELAQERIDSIVRVYENRKKKEDKAKDGQNEEANDTKFNDAYADTDVEATEYESMIEPYSPTPLEINGNEVESIPPEEYGTMDDYTEVSYDFTSNGELKDEMGDDVEMNTAIRNFINSSINTTEYFRSSVMKMDYEILKEQT